MARYPESGPKKRRTQSASAQFLEKGGPGAAGLHPDPPVDGVDVDDPVEAGGINNQAVRPVRYGTARIGVAAAAGNDGIAEPGRRSDHAAESGDVARSDNPGSNVITATNVFGIFGATPAVEDPVVRSQNFTELPLQRLFTHARSCPAALSDGVSPR